MKRIFLILTMLFLCSPVFAADTKISDLTEDTAPQKNDYTVTVDTSAGTNKKVTLGNTLNAESPTFYINDTTGNVGIGTSTPATKLNVSGNMIVSGIGTFGSMNVSGNTTFDTNTLFVDSVNNRVGIGNSAPGQTFNIGTDTFYVTTGSGGYVGIGTTNPISTEKLYVNGNIKSVTGGLVVGSATDQNETILTVDRATTDRHLYYNNTLDVFSTDAPMIVSGSGSRITLTNDSYIDGATSLVTSLGGVNIWDVGSGTDSDIRVRANNSDATKPEIRYQAASSEWQYTNDGSTFVSMGTGTFSTIALGPLSSSVTSLDVQLPWAGTIVGATVIGDGLTGNGTVTFTKSNYSDFPTYSTLGTVTLTSATKNTDTTLSGWTTSLSSGDLLRAQVTGTTGTITFMNPYIKIKKQ